MKFCFSTVPVFRKSKIFVQQINLFISWKSKGNDYILSEILDIQLISFYRYWLGFLDILSHLLKYQAFIWFTWRIENILSLCHGHSVSLKYYICDTMSLTCGVAWTREELTKLRVFMIPSILDQLIDI